MISIVFYCIFATLILKCPRCFSLSTISNNIKESNPIKVIVTSVGAENSVGYLVFKRLLRKKSFLPIGIVSDKIGAQALRRLGVRDEQIQQVDLISSKYSSSTNPLPAIFEGAKKAVICTTATPKWKLSYKIKSVFRWLLRRERAPRPTELYYDKGHRPYDIDYLAQKHIIDACEAAQVEHVVLLGSMGGYRGTKLNDVGRSEGSTDIKEGNILKWKRASERYLMKRCFFTILHAGQLTDDKGGQSDVIWDTDDALLRTQFRKISKEDVAEVIVQALVWKEAIGRSIDIASGPGKGPMKDWLRFWSRPGDCVYPADFDDLSFR